MATTLAHDEPQVQRDLLYLSHGLYTDNILTPKAIIVKFKNIFFKNARNYFFYIKLFNSF